MPRRIFELAATGTIVVSTPAEAIDASVPSEIIRVVGSAGKTTEAISTLLEDSGLRDHATVVGPQWIQDGHTYQHRMASIIEVL
jgi:hypothetical protein